MRNPSCEACKACRNDYKPCCARCGRPFSGGQASFAILQRLEETRVKAEAATQAAGKAEKQIAALEIQIPKAEMEVGAQLQRAKDLQDRLVELQNATKVCKRCYLIYTYNISPDLVYFACQTMEQLLSTYQKV